MAHKEEVIDYIEELSKTLKVLSIEIEHIESDLKKIKNTLVTLSNLKDNIGDLDAIVKASKSKKPVQTSSWNSIEGEFDGYFMVGDDAKKYPVPINYASKSKLISGDRLKVTIKDGGELVYKLIEPAQRQHVKAILSQDEKDTHKYYAIAEDKQTYNLNTAAVTFFKWLPGDEAYITINKSWKGNYAALEAIIKTSS